MKASSVNFLLQSPRTWSSRKSRMETFTMSGPTFRDELLVEKEVMSIGQLKDGAKDFLIATGTGLLHPERPNVTLGDDNMKYP